jgi:SAM-dependent methyltransferase
VPDLDPVNSGRAPGSNLDERVVEGFGREWQRFDQRGMSRTEAFTLFMRYFAKFPWEMLPAGACGFDAGCGSGRWARFVAPRVGTLHCVDASPGALGVAKKTLADQRNCEFHLAAVDDMPIADNTMDFGYSVGVLHHIPDTPSGLCACVRALKPGAPFLLYLYYTFDNRPRWFRIMWRASDGVRRLLSRCPFPVRSVICDLLAVSVYLPLARTARLAEWMGISVDHAPLSAYRDQSLYVMRTDALDRLGTRLERRFSRADIHRLMTHAGLADIRFQDTPPYWVAVGHKSPSPDTTSAPTLSSAP